MTGAYLCFEDEAGQNLTPPRSRTWGRRGQSPIVKVNGRSCGRISIAGMIAARDRLTAVLLPAYAPDLNPVEWAWAHLKHSLANLTAGTLDRLKALIRTRLKSLQYQPDLLDGFIAGTGLILNALPP